MACDWTKIKTEYITDSKSSYRKIAEKYEVSFNTLQCRAKKEGWADLKRQAQDKITKKTIDKDIEKKVDRATRLMDVTDKLLNKVEEAIEELSTAGIVLNAQALKQISGTLKDIKEVHGVKSDRDIREQEARIRNLEKQAEATDDKPNEITITIAGGDKSWAE
jgi:transposase